MSSTGLVLREVIARSIQVYMNTKLSKDSGFQTSVKAI